MPDTTAKRAEALAYVFADEGGYAERGTEGGGAVNRGITYATFKDWVRKQGKPMPTWSDLKAMSEAEATEIYVAHYLAPIHFDDLPYGVGYAVLDAAILGGVGGATKILNRVLGWGAQGALWTPITKWAVNHREPIALINKLCDDRLATYRTFKNWSVPVKEGSSRTWGEGWTARIERVRGRALEMAVLHAGGQPVATPPASPPVPPPQFSTGPAKPSPRPSLAVLNPAYIEPASSTWKGTVGLGVSPADFRRYLSQQKFTGWRPQGIVLHNTDHPQLHSYARGSKSYEGWHETKGGVVQRLKNIAHGYRTRGWKSGPHLFVDDEQIWIFTPLTVSGTHSPSYNATHWAIEMVGNYSLEPFNEKVRDLTVAALAIMCEVRGLDPDKIIRHGSDPKTSHHDCPGKNVSLDDIKKRVRTYMAQDNDLDADHSDVAAA